MRSLLGGKSCELAEMTNLGIPVPPGFTITTQAWAAYNRTGRQFPEGMWEQVAAALKETPPGMGLLRCRPPRPPLLCRPARARPFMPGMNASVGHPGAYDRPP